mgnify:CR=1 FL=1
MIEGQRNIPSQDGNQLLENRNNKFENVSSDKGIFSSNIGFGLGITLSDFNGDLWPDLFISNDFFEKDYLYLNNNGDGFSEESLTYFDALSMGSMGADAADMDNDLIPDLIVTEMLPETLSRQKNKQVYESYDKFTLAGSKGYHKQYPRNALQRNLGNTFYEVGRQLGLSATEWSWAALLFDMDNDGYKDVYISNGIYKDLLDRDYLNYYANDEQISQILREGKEVITDLIDLMPSKAVTNSVFRNNGDFTFSDKRLGWGLNQPSFSNGSAYGDLDNDGDLDLVVNNVNSEAFIFENHSEVENHQTSWVALELNTPNWGEQSEFRFHLGAPWRGRVHERFVILVREVRKPRRRRTKKKKKVFVQWFDCSRSNKIDDLSQTEIFIELEKIMPDLLNVVTCGLCMCIEKLCLSMILGKVLANNSNLEWYGSPWN